MDSNSHCDMNRLIGTFVAHFDQLRDRMACFHKYGVQVEGWFKGELLLILYKQVINGTIQSFDREVNIEGSRSKVDLKVTIDDCAHWIELKHWLIGEQHGTSYSPSFYFGDPQGLLKDVDKLCSIRGEDKRWLLLLLTKNPGVAAWESGLGKFANKFSYTLKPYTDPRKFDKLYFLSLLQVV